MATSLNQTKLLLEQGFKNSFLSSAVLVSLVVVLAPVKPSPLPNVLFQIISWYPCINISQTNKKIDFLLNTYCLPILLVHCLKVYYISSVTLLFMINGSGSEQCLACAQCFAETLSSDILSIRSFFDASTPFESASQLPQGINKPILS